MSLRPGTSHRRWPLRLRRPWGHRRRLLAVTGPTPVRSSGGPNSPPPTTVPFSVRLRSRALWLGSAACRHPRRALVAVAGTGGLAAGWLGGPVAATIAAAYLGLGLRTAANRAAAKARRDRRVRQLDALAAHAADLRAGLPAGPMTLRDSGPTTGTAATRLAGLSTAAVRLAERTGAPLADLIERIEADARALDRSRDAAAAQAAGAQMTAWLLAGLPAGGLALGYSIGVDPVAVLLRTPIGAACALAAVALQVAGLAWTERLNRAPEATS
ncbi:type II secretion system F family protein [Micromonospora sp. LOL_014]|uniref:type II secretion system F family protein n=1 Tax=Micromonospora sp. LOL_014 TaxID=3345415 RepID=UPI003A882BCC